MSSAGTAAAVCGAELLRRAEELLHARDLTASRDAFDRAEADGADADQCSAGRWMVHMLAGDFCAAWRESDAIRARGAHDPHRFWNGENVTGKRAMVRCLHGLGDAVQMLRYLPQLRERCAHVVVEVPPRLLDLARCFDGIDEAITWGDAAPAQSPPWDVQVEVMELPYLFRSTARDLPIATNYLHVPAPLQHGIASAMGVSAAPRIGLVWSASEWDPTRCLPMDCLHRITRLEGFEFWNLQGGDTHDLSLHEPALAGVRDAAPLGDGVLTLAAAMEQLDLVITVDTLAAHLAGALGKPAWVLLQHAADWRWMHGRSDSPWYPTLRLFRQPSPGDWRGMVDQVSLQLKQWLRSC